tara:strand:- start:144144 stop:144422 length:279 start_codon:yes stop_codon:yes gene_type:complete
MKIQLKLWMISLFLFASLSAVAANQEDADTAKNIKYREGKKIDFESLLIEGENKKPQLSVVTGNLGERDLGLIKVRENFLDYMVNNAGEELE